MHVYSQLFAVLAPASSSNVSYSTVLLVLFFLSSSSLLLFWFLFDPFDVRAKLWL
jgi:hypothetical protein